MSGTQLPEQSGNMEKSISQQMFLSGDYWTSFPPQDHHFSTCCFHSSGQERRFHLLQRHISHRKRKTMRKKQEPTRLRWWLHFKMSWKSWDKMFWRKRKTIYWMSPAINLWWVENQKEAKEPPSWIMSVKFGLILASDITIPLYSHLLAPLSLVLQGKCLISKDLVTNSSTIHIILAS